MEQLDIRQPRSFGYQIGDKFERFIHLQLRKPYELEISALPTQGRHTMWLALEAPHIEQKNLTASTQYKIILSYQIVNIDPEVRNISVPELYLQYTNGKDAFKLLVPASWVGVSVLHDHQRGYLQADRIPSLLPQAYLRSIVFGSLLVAALAGLIFLHWGLPALTKTHPFVTAYRGLRKLRHRPWDDECYRDALRNIHQAFNDTAGRTVFAERLTEFFNDHNRYAPLKQSINDYFTHSRRYFFESENDDQIFQYSLSELVSFVQECRDIERGLS